MLRSRASDARAPAPPSAGVSSSETARTPIEPTAEIGSILWTVRRSGHWLLVDLGREHRTLGWTVAGGGFAHARRVAWLGVRDGDLRAGVDPVDLVAARLRAEGSTIEDQPVFLTSSNLDAYVDARAEVEGIAARCVATVGMSNAARIGERSPARTRERTGTHVGTINVLCGVSVPLDDLALVEAISMIAAARTTAVLEARMAIAGAAGEGGTVLATGTGTDCCVVAAPRAARADASPARDARRPNDAPHAYAGLHTALGEAIGRATLDAVSRGVAAWREAAAR